ncbi:MAG: alpha/beta hydrolase [Dermatophilaceae bacterium]
MAIYFPDPTPVPPAAFWFPGGRDVELTTEDGLTLTAWFIPALGVDRRTAVLFAPGNGGHRAGRVPLFAALAERGFTVLALDYRGYGGNPGRPSEEGLAADARAAAEYLRVAGYPPDRTIYVGESLGTGVVVRLATTHRPAGLALRSPYTSLAALAAIHVAFLPLDGVLVDRFALLDDLAGLDVPVTVIHGAADDIVPSELSVRVADAAPRLQEELRLPGVGHNDAVMFGPVIADAVVRLADATIGHDV